MSHENQRAAVTHRPSDPVDDAPLHRSRRIPFEGAINFRDLGGYPTRDGRRVAWGRLYRSDALWQFTDGDLKRFASLGIRTVCDLRAEPERLRWPNRLPAQDPPTTLALGFTPHGTLDTWAAINRGEITPQGVSDYMRKHYRAFADLHVEHFAAAFLALLQPGAIPALIHCASGKDRTGFGAAMILLALGVSRADILEDYAVSDRHRRSLSHLFHDQVDPLAYEAVAAARTFYLESALEQVDRYPGGEDRYLAERLGMDAPRRQRLQSLLLDST